MARAKKSDQLLAKLNRSLDTPHAAAAAPAAAAPVAKPASPEKAPAAPAPRPVAAANPPPPIAPPPVAPGAAAVSPRRAAAVDMVNRHLPFALGAGLVPLPLADVAAITGVQLKLLSALAAHYDVPFPPNRAKAIIASLIGGAGAWTLAAGVFGSLAKAVPGVGTWLGASTLPLSAGAVTYALGHVVINHFEGGGTLLDFDTATARRAFLEKIAEAKTALRHR